MKDKAAHNEVASPTYHVIGILLYVSLLKTIRLSDDRSYRISQFHRNSYNPCATQAKGFLFNSLNAASSFKFEIDTLPVHEQGVLFLIEFRNLTISPIKKNTLLA